MSICSIWAIDRTLSGATTPGQSELGGNGKREILHIYQSSSITGASPSVCLVSYPRHSWRLGGGVLPLQRFSRYIQPPHLTGLVSIWGQIHILIHEKKNSQSTSFFYMDSNSTWRPTSRTSKEVELAWIIGWLLEDPTSDNTWCLQ